MSLFSDLLQAGGSYLGNKAQADTKNRAAELEYKTASRADALTRAGTVGPTGSVIGRVDDVTGAPTTTLSPKMLEVLNQNIANTQLIGSQGEDRLGIVSGRLGDLSRTRPTLEGITNEVKDDSRRIQESIIKPAIDTAALADVRGGRNRTSNVFSPSSNVGRAVRDLGNTIDFRQGDEIRNRFAKAQADADADAIRLNPNVTGVTIPGAPPPPELAAGAGFKLAGMTPLDTGAGNLGNTFARFGALQAAGEKEKSLHNAIARGLGNQFNPVPGVTGTNP